MAQLELVLVITVPRWVRWWLAMVAFVALVMHAQPDPEKVTRFVARHVRCRWVRLGGQGGQA